MRKLLRTIHRHILAFRIWLHCKRNADAARRVEALLALHQNGPDIAG
jgi:hypothetical protein